MRWIRAYGRHALYKDCLPAWPADSCVQCHSILLAISRIPTREIEQERERLIGSRVVRPTGVVATHAATFAMHTHANSLVQYMRAGESYTPMECYAIINVCIQ